MNLNEIPAFVGNWFATHHSIRKFLRYFVLGGVVAGAGAVIPELQVDSTTSMSAMIGLSLLSILENWAQHNLINPDDKTTPVVATKPPASK